MTIREIVTKLNTTTLNNVWELANHLASLDTQTALEIIEKYNTDIKLSQKQLSEEITKQTIRSIENEY